MQACKVRSHSHKHERRNKRTEGRGGERQHREDVKRKRRDTGVGGGRERFNAAAGKTSGHPEELRTSAARARSTGAALPAPRLPPHSSAPSSSPTACGQRGPPPPAAPAMPRRRGHVPGAAPGASAAARSALPAGHRRTRLAPSAAQPRAGLPSMPPRSVPQPSAPCPRGGGPGAQRPRGARDDRTAPRSPGKTFPAENEGDPGAGRPEEPGFSGLLTAVVFRRGCGLLRFPCLYLGAGGRRAHTDFSLRGGGKKSPSGEQRRQPAGGGRQSGESLADPRAAGQPAPRTRAGTPTARRPSVSRRPLVSRRAPPAPTPLSARPGTLRREPLRAERKR